MATIHDIAKFAGTSVATVSMVTSGKSGVSPKLAERVRKAVEALVYRPDSLARMGLVRHIGTSNLTIAKLRLLLQDAQIRPAVNEMELHRHFQQPELFEFVSKNGMEPIV